MSHSWSPTPSTEGPTNESPTPCGRPRYRAGSRAWTTHPQDCKACYYLKLTPTRSAWTIKRPDSGPPLKRPGPRVHQSLGFSVQVCSETASLPAIGFVTQLSLGETAK